MGWCTREDVGGGVDGSSELRREQVGPPNGSQHKGSQEQACGAFTMEERASRGGEVLLRWQRTPLTFVPKRMNGSINVAEETAEC